MDNIDQYINDFNDAIDKELELQHDLNEFAREISEKLFDELDKEGVLANFNNEVNFSFKFTTYQASLSALRYDVRLLDLDNYRKCMMLSVPEKVMIKRANFEHDPQYQLKDELRNVLVMLLFDYFNIHIGPEEQGEEELVTVKG